MEGGKNMKKLLPILLVGLLVFSGLGAVALPNRYQKAEVQNVSDNTSTVSYESRLESGELPYWLDGTILNGNYRVVVSEDGLTPPFQKPGSYDYAITFEEAQSIADDARQRYIDTYGIDPCPPEPTKTRINLVQCPFESDFIKTGASRGGPHQLSGQLCALVFPAKNSRDKPNNPTYLFSQTKTGFNRFKAFNNVQALSFLLLGYWDASNVPSGSDIYKYDDDLYDDLCDYWLEDANCFLVGWVKNAAGSDAGCGGGWSCCMKENCNVIKSVLAQHEISHIFNALDHYWSFWPPCVMSYFWYLLGYSSWCNSCYHTIYNAIWR
jgi:hypothetical protein